MDLYETAIAEARVIAQLRRRIRLGFGQGQRDDFAPWDRIRRSRSSRTSNIHVTPIRLSKRGLRHLATPSTQSAALVGRWLGGPFADRGDMRRAPPCVLPASQRLRSKRVRSLIGCP